MKTKLLTDVELRAAWAKGERGCRTVPEGTIVTPAARDFLREHHMELCFEAAAHRAMPMAAVPLENGKPKFVDAVTGQTRTEKPETMTHLHDNVLVMKSHPRIAFRGKLDSLSAEILSVQVDVQNARLAEDLEQLRIAVLNILSAEVLEKPLPPLTLWGMDADGIRRSSHHVHEELGVAHLMPDRSMGRLPIAMNLLRTRIREAELSAVAAFGESRTDITLQLNRLSSCAYILYCRLLAGFYDGGKL